MTIDELEKAVSMPSHLIDVERQRWSIAPMRRILARELQDLIEASLCKLEFVDPSDLKHQQGFIAGLRAALVKVQKTVS